MSGIESPPPWSEPGGGTANIFAFTGPHAQHDAGRKIGGIAFAKSGIDGYQDKADIGELDDEVAVFGPSDVLGLWGMLGPDFPVGAWDDATAARHWGLLQLGGSGVGTEAGLSLLQPGQSEFDLAQLGLWPDFGPQQFAFEGTAILRAAAVWFEAGGEHEMDCVGPSFDRKITWIVFTNSLSDEYSGGGQGISDTGGEAFTEGAQYREAFEIGLGFFYSHQIVIYMTIAAASK